MAPPRRGSVLTCIRIGATTAAAATAAAAGYGYPDVAATKEKHQPEGCSRLRHSSKTQTLPAWRRRLLGSRTERRSRGLRQVCCTPLLARRPDEGLFGLST
ncbi:uncharacterized protein SETTUDRAFT_30871 [Exserohilum turcica Et28A]|uniref:Secreted protein n=1 Tax=Exserohilum turcicum (strain 28A) TaxID=671987 RepID=R0K089_EXST2|nr:uncharacterized protein SETTUDRAFT_30871 [Exserohilum turcica Et28A]EOA86538.1 hypothetical protein SETTUDRAFT_30871 [Exserohilum turcica Et28A]